MWERLIRKILSDLPLTRDSKENTMRKRTFLIIITTLLLCFSCAFAAELTGKDYTIASNDIVEITVYEEPDLSTTARVAPDGIISFPLLGNIKVAGLSARRLEEEIIKLLGEDYLVNPQVKVFVKQYANISILGEVKSPGSYQMREKLTLTETVALSGGFTPLANTSKVKIIRSIAGKDEKETLYVDLDKVLEKSLPDIELKPNDVIIIDPFSQFSIIGQVAKPGVYNLKKNLTIIEAIGMAGGFTPIAAQNATKIFREENNKKVTIRVPVADIMQSPDKNKNIFIKEKDTIVVPESFF